MTTATGTPGAASLQLLAHWLASKEPTGARHRCEHTHAHARTLTCGHTPTNLHGCGRTALRITSSQTTSCRLSAMRGLAWVSLCRPLWHAAAGTRPGRLRSFASKPNTAGELPFLGVCVHPGVPCRSTTDWKYSLVPFEEPRVLWSTMYYPSTSHSP